MARFAGCSKWAAMALAASGVLTSPRAAQAQQHTFHLDRLEVPGSPDDGLVLFRPVTRPGAIFYAQLGLGLSIDPLRMSNIGIDSASNTARQVPTHVITSQFSTYISAGFELLDRVTLGATFPAAWIQAGNQPASDNSSTTTYSTTGPAVGDTRLEDSATSLTPPLGIAWTSPDGTHWERVADEGGVLGNIVLHAVVAGSTGFLASGNDLGGQTALAFSNDGVHWRREDTEAVFANSNVTGITWTGQDFVAVGGHNVAQPSGVISQIPGNAAAWWSNDGQNWQASDVPSPGYSLESVQPWIDSLRASGLPPCPRCVSAPAEWRSSDDGRTWRQLPLAATADYPGLASLVVGQRLVNLQDQPLRATWSADGQTWTSLQVKGSPIPDTAQLVAAVGGQTVIAIASVTGASANDQEDMRVFAGQLH